jgi:HSP20 family protein
MPELVIWKQRRIDRLKRDMDRMVQRMLSEFRAASTPGITWKQPSYDLIETEKDIVLKAEIPGADPDKLEIDISDNILTIEGETKQESVSQEESYRRVERRFGSFSRSIPIPRRIVLSKVKATFKKGVLTIVMPKFSGEEKRGLKVRIR